MSIRRYVYLSCDDCLRICDGSDADDAREARRIGKQQGWRRIAGRDLCPPCQGDRSCGIPHCTNEGELIAPGIVRCARHQ